MNKVIIKGYKPSEVLTIAPSHRGLSLGWGGPPRWDRRDDWHYRRYHDDGGGFIGGLVGGVLGQVFSGPSRAPDQDTFDLALTNIAKVPEGADVVVGPREFRSLSDRGKVEYRDSIPYCLGRKLVIAD